MKAWLRCLVDNCRSPTSHREGTHAASELRGAEKIWFKQIQRYTYAKQRAQLQGGQGLEEMSSMRDLNLVIYEKGVIRIRTRPHNTNVT